MTRVLIIDDHEIARRGIEQALAGKLPGAQFGEAATSEEATAQLQSGTWDLVLVDLNLPGRGGLEILADLRQRWPRLPVLVVSAYAEEEFALRCLKLGASGYVTKTSGLAEILAAAKRALAGGKYVTPALAERLAGTIGGDVPAPTHDVLTPRELQVLRLVALGRSLKEVASELHLSERTVATYRARIAEKLGLSSAVEIARYALKHRLVE
ncbi:MAG: response regulator transcription factor [Anaeromyxobacter sp.]